MSRHLSGGTDNTTEHLSQDGRSPGRDLNVGPQENEVVDILRAVRLGRMRNVRKILIVKPERKIILGIPGLKLEVNFKMGLTGMVWKEVDFNHET